MLIEGFGFQDHMRAGHARAQYGKYERGVGIFGYALRTTGCQAAGIYSDIAFRTIRKKNDIGRNVLAA